MQRIKCLPLVVPLAFALQLVLAVTASAQPGNGLLAAGDYHITTQTADYFSCCGDPSLPTLSVNVRDTTTVANPLVGPSMVTHETDVDVFACGGSNFICGGGCFIAGAGDFTGGGLSAAALNTRFDPATSLPCENRPVGLPAFTVSFNWSGTGPVGSTRKTSQYSCVGYTAEVQTLSSNVKATSSATFSLASGSLPTDSAGLGSIDQRWHAQGDAQDACQSFGLGGVGGKGAGGGGPTGNGGFELAVQNAGANIPFGFINLATVTRVTRPTGAPPTTFHDTELTVVSFGFPFFAYCYVLQSPNTFSFGSGLSSASVNAAIDQNTPACVNFPNSPFVPFTANLTWTAAGPLASIQSTAISDCGAFHQVTLSTDATDPAGATGNVSILGDISSPQSSINSSDHRFEDMGTAPQGCLLRP